MGFDLYLFGGNHCIKLYFRVHVRYWMTPWMLSGDLRLLSFRFSVVRLVLFGDFECLRLFRWTFVEKYFDRS